VVTPLVWQRWKDQLKKHPDREWVDFLVRRRARLVKRQGAMYEQSKHREVIENYLENKVKRDRLSDPKTSGSRNVNSFFVWCNILRKGNQGNRECAF